jgi:hypothetical protein
MKVFQSFLPRHRLFVLLTGLLALLAAPGYGQVTSQQILNGLVDYYPLNSINPGGYSTPDLISRRDLVLVNMNSNNIVPGTHPGIESTQVLNFNQSGGPTVAYYNTTRQNPFDGSGDFLPFINQRGATMNFWVKAANNLSGNEYRVMAECAQDGQSSPFFSISTKSGASLGTNASFFLRAQNPSTDPNGQSAYAMADGTWEDPVINYYWNQGSNDTTSVVFDNTWHMLTMTIGINGDMHVYVDGKYDQGDQLGGPWIDNEGNLTVAPSIPMTNSYYNTNVYPNLTLLPAGTNTPSQYVRWLMPDLCNSGVTTFGGFMRNYAFGGGLVCQMSDIGFWNRVLSTNEIQYVFTKGALSGGTNNVTWTGTVSFVTTNNITFATYSWLLLAFECENLVGMGPLIRTNNAFWYDFDLSEPIMPPGCPQHADEETTPVILGTLAPGVYTLVTTSWSAPVMTNTFTVTPALQASGFDTNGYFQMQMSGGVTNVNYVLQYSTDLVNWISLSTNTVSANTVGVALTDYYPVLSGVGFYRVLCQ